MYNTSRNEFAFSGFLLPTVTATGLLGSFAVVTRLMNAYQINYKEKTTTTLCKYLVISLVFGIALKASLKIYSRWKDSRQNPSMKREKSDLFQMARESSAASFTKIRQVSSIAMKQLPCFKAKSETYFVPVFSATEPFVSLLDLKKTTLTELSDIIKYTILCTGADFEENSFISGEPHHVQNIIHATNTAVIKSRGFNVSAAKTEGTTSNGNYDALYFCAASRLIVDWRAVKAVPEEYKAYAVGMKMAQRDLIQNIAKVEDGVHKWIDSKVLAGIEEINSPTISQLLKYELLNGIHPRLPKLKDNTVAIGVVWMYRQLQFQSEIFRNLQECRVSNDSAMDAMKAAYKTVFDNYHGWALQQGFNYAFKGAPPISMIFSMMNPDLSVSIENKANEADVVILPMTFHSTDKDRDDEVVENMFHGFDLFQNIGRGWKTLSGKVEQEWFGLIDKLVMGGNNPEKEKRSSVRSSSESETDADESITSDGSLSVKTNCHEYARNSIPSFVLSGPSLELHIKEETSKAAKTDMKVYSTVMSPMLEDISRTINDFGMNDPSKV